ncbi:MAG TPA: glycosyltransferase family 39 protein [Ktedonobacterales bacterium]|nr:glycosyltransferase family 39 protein [Ktedonobacterales bacterium]
MDETVKRRAVATAEPEVARALAQARGMRRIEAWAPLMVGLAALALNLTRLGAPSLWMDEAFSVQLARQPLSTVLAAYSSGAEPNMIAYHLALHGWLALGAALGLPATEFFVRLPSAVFAAAAASALYALGRRFLGRTAAVAAAVVYAASGWQLTYAQEARGYALQLALVVVGWLALLAAVSARSSGWRAWRWWALFVAAMTLAVYTQAFSALVLLAQGLALGAWLVWPSAWRALARRALPGALASFVAIGLLITPFVLTGRSGSKTGWLPSPSVAELAGKLEGLLGSGHRLALALGAAVALGLAAGAALWLLATPAGVRLRTRLPLVWGRMDGGALIGEARPAAGGLALWVVVPAALSYVISLGPDRIFSSRYLVVILPGLCLLLGAGVAALRWPVGRLVAVGALAVVMVALAPSYYAHAQVEDWRTPVRWLERAYHPGDGLVAYNNVQGCELPVDYYLETDGSAARFDADSPGVVQWSLYGHGNPFKLFGKALERSALAAYAAEHPRLFFIEGRFADARDAAKAHATQAWLDAHYRLIGQTSNGVVTIRLYDTRE